MSKTVHEVLCVIQTQLKAAKGQQNKFGGYKYRSAEDILEALKPLLAEHKATVVLSDKLVMVGERYYVEATCTLTVGGESITTSSYAREEESKKGMDGSQVTGASSSYARKYAMNGMFAIDDSKDSDATNTHGKDKATVTTKARSTSDEPSLMDKCVAHLKTAKNRQKVYDQIVKNKSDQLTEKQLAALKKFVH